MVQRPTIPRTIIMPPPPATSYQLVPADGYTYLRPVSATRPVSPPVVTDNQAMAERIAEILAPTSGRLLRRSSSVDLSELRRQARREAEARAEAAAINNRRIEEEAKRRVKERNARDDRRAAELRSMEDDARLRIESDFRSSTSSVRSRSSGGYGSTSRDRLVVVEQSPTPARASTSSHRCSNCHTFGHRSRECKTVVTFTVGSGRPARRHSISHRGAESPKKQVRYVDRA